MDKRLPANTVKPGLWSAVLLCSLLGSAQATGQRGPNAAVLSWQAHKQKVLAVGFLAQGKGVVSGSQTWEIKAWDPGTGQELATLQRERPAPGLMTAMTLSHDRLLLAYGGAFDRNIYLCDMHTNQLKAVLLGPIACGEGLAISPDGNKLAAYWQDDRVRLHDIASRQQLAGWDVSPYRFIKVLRYGPDGKTLTWGVSRTCQAIVWDITAGKPAIAFDGFKGSPLGMAYSPDGKLLAIATDSASDPITVWETTKYQVQVKLNQDKQLVKILGLAFSPDGRSLAAVGAGFKNVGAARIWDVGSRQQIALLGEKIAGAICVDFSPDGKKLVTGHNDGTVRIWDVPARK